MDREELVALIKEAMKVWEETEWGAVVCLFCRRFMLLKNSCPDCPIQGRFGHCFSSERNPFSEYYLNRRGVEVNHNNRREAILLAGRRWLNQLEKEEKDE